MLLAHLENFLDQRRLLVEFNLRKGAENGSRPVVSSRSHQIQLILAEIGTGATQIVSLLSLPAGSHDFFQFSHQITFI